MKSQTIGVATIVAAATLSGCSTTPERHAALEDVRSDYDRLAAQQDVRRFADDQLKDAEQAVQRAERVWQENRDEELLEHHLYLAERRMDIAEQAAALGQAEQVVQNAEDERRQILSEIRQTDPNNSVLSRDDGFADDNRGYSAGSNDAAEPLEQDLAELEDQLTALDARRSEEGLVLSLENAVFEPDESTLDSGYERTLDDIAELLNEYPGYRLHIRNSSTDPTDPYDIGLAERRARAIEEALIGRGVDRERFSGMASGAGDPIAAQPGEVRRPPNSAVEIVIEVPV